MDLLKLRTRLFGGDKYIKFVDPEVERICVANFSSDGIGVTYEDAAAVTSIYRVFVGNADITSFKELMYFTGLTSITSYDFQGCDSLTVIGVPPYITSFCVDRSNVQHIYVVNLEGFLSRTDVGAPVRQGYHLYMGNTEITSIVFPAGSTSVGNNVLAGASYINSIEIPNTVITIGTKAFYICGSLTGNLSLPVNLESIGEGAFMGTDFNGELTIPASVTFIGEQAFRGVPFSTVKMRPTTPPIVYDLTFANATYTIYVPYSEDHSILNNYKSAWSNLQNRIGELNPDGSFPTS